MTAVPWRNCQEKVGGVLVRNKRTKKEGSKIPILATVGLMAGLFH